MNKLIINLDRVRANVGMAQQYAAQSGYDLVGVLKAVQNHPKLIATLLAAGANSLAFSSIASVAALSAVHRPDREICLLLGPTAPQSAGEAVRYFSASIQSTHATLEALGKASRDQGLGHAVFLALRTDDGREGVDIFDQGAIDAFVAKAASEGLSFAGLACNLGCTQLEPLAAVYIAQLQAVRARLAKQLERPIALSLGGSFILPDLPQLDGPKSVRVGELLLSGSEPAGRAIAGCATAFHVEASIVEIHAKGGILVDIGSAILEQGHYEIALRDAKTISMSGEFMVIQAEFDTPPKVGDAVRFGLGYECLKKALAFPFLKRQWREGQNA